MFPLPRAAARSSGRVRRPRTARHWSRTPSPTGIWDRISMAAERDGKASIAASCGGKGGTGSKRLVRSGCPAASGVIFNSTVQGRLMPRAG